MFLEYIKFMKTFLLPFILTALLITPGCSSGSSDPLTSACQGYSKYLENGENARNIWTDLLNATPATEETRPVRDGFEYLDKTLQKSSLSPWYFLESINETEEEKLLKRRLDAAIALIETTCFPEKFPDLYSSEQVLEKLNSMGLGEWTQQEKFSSTDTWETPESLYSSIFILKKNEKIVCWAGVYLTEVVAGNNRKRYNMEDEMIWNRNVTIIDHVSLFATSGTAISKEYTSLQEPGACLKNW
jgi:hypothetical protein